MSVNPDLRIRAAEALKHTMQSAEHLLSKYQKHVMSNKLQPIFQPGQRVTVKASGTVYTGTVLSNEKRIYTHGENGYLEVMCQWDNPASHWRGGIFGFNQIHLTLLTDDGTGAQPKKVGPKETGHDLYPHKCSYCEIRFTSMVDKVFHEDIDHKDKLH